MSGSLGVVHHVRLEGPGRRVQAYIHAETGRVSLDLNGLAGMVEPFSFTTDDARRLVGILRAAIADKETG